MGYRTEDIDTLIWQDYLDLHKYWKSYPPIHVLAAGWMGYKSKEVDKNANQDFALEELMQVFGVKVVPKGEANV